MKILIIFTDIVGMYLLLPDHVRAQTTTQHLYPSIHPLSIPQNAHPFFIHKTLKKIFEKRGERGGERGESVRGKGEYCVLCVCFHVCVC